MPQLILNNGTAVSVPPARQMAAQVMNRATMGPRTGLPGQTFGGNRDLYQVLGYKTELLFDDYLAKFSRGDIASRVVEAPAEDTWRDEPEAQEGQGEEAKTETPFTKQLTAVLTELDAWAQFENVDTLAGIGHYAVLFIGFGDEGEGAALDTAVSPTAKPAYLSAYSEGQATIHQIEKDTKSPRMGLPLTYKIKFDELGKATTVHYSRVIHIAEKARHGRVYGTPRLQRVYNRLDDLEKVIGGSAEAFWKLVYKGIIISLKDGYLPPEDEDEINEMTQKIEDYINDIARFMMIDGYDVKELGSQTVDPSAMIDVLVSIIAAATGIPKRLLIGAELGNIASTQDAANWAGRISARRTRFAEPRILRPFVEMLAAHGVITIPAAGYSWKWKPLFELDGLQTAQIGYVRAQTLKAVSGDQPKTIATREELRGIAGLNEKLDGKTAAELEAEDEPEPATPNPFDPQDGQGQPGEDGDGEGDDTAVPPGTGNRRRQHGSDPILPTLDDLPFLNIEGPITERELAEAIEAFYLDNPELLGLVEAGIQ